MKKFIFIVLIPMLFLSCSCSSEDINAAYNALEKQFTPENEILLWRAINTKNYELVKEAVAQGANINRFSNILYRERIGNNIKVSSPLLIAMISGRFQIAEYLIECGADVNYKDREGQSVLQYCAEFFPKMIRSVLEAGADISYQDKEGNSALEYAACYEVNNATETSFDVLLEYGAIPTAKTIERLLEDFTIEKYGMLRKAFLKTGQENFDQALYAAFVGEEEIVKQSIDESPYRDFVLGGIAAFGSAETLNAVLTEADMSLMNDLLKTAALYDNYDVMEYLINSEQVTSFQDDKGLLYYAAKNNDVPLVNMIYQSKLSSSTAWAAISAIEFRNQDVLKNLLNNGLDPNAKCLFGPLLENAVFFENLDAVELLLEYGADVNGGADYRYGDPLQTAVENGNVEIVKCLINNGADVNADSEGYGSILMRAVSGGQLECVKILVENGADIFYEAKWGSIFDEAKKTGGKNIYHYLSSQIENQNSSSNEQKE